MTPANGSLRLALKIGTGGILLAAEATALPAEAVVGLVVVTVIGVIWLANRSLSKPGH